MPRGFTIKTLTSYGQLGTSLLTIESGITIPRHVHAKKQKAYYVVSGSGEITLDEKTELLEPGQAVTVPSRVIHSLKAFNPGLTIIVAFSPITGSEDINWLDGKPED